jgi:hypothetical protein
VFAGRIIFDHLPKTAGESIRDWLTHALGSGCVTPHVSGDHRELIREHGGLYSVISAHVNFANGEGLDPRYQYITLLRDPIDRAISWLFFVLNNAPKIVETLALREGTRRFLDSDGSELAPEIRDGISNLYVRHFYRIDCDAMIVEREVEAALSVIKKYEIVGTYEEMPRFVADVASLVGLPAPASIPRVNVTSQRPAVNRISERLRQRLVDLNGLDIELYNAIAHWLKSNPSTAEAGTSRNSVFRSRKYDRVLDRVLVTPDAIVASAALREGYDIERGQVLTFDVDFFLAREVVELEVGIHIFDRGRRWAFGTNSTMLGHLHRDLPRNSYRASFHVIAELPIGKYTAGFALAERLGDEQRELAWYHTMCEFQVHHSVGQRFAGCSYLPTQITLSPTLLASERHVIVAPTGSLSLTERIPPMPAGARRRISVDVTNASKEHWLGNVLRPVGLSYHWLNSAEEMYIFDGVRTPIPEDGIAVGQVTRTEMEVAAPAEPGDYFLILTLVQDRVGWFEERGFTPAKVKVEILPVTSLLSISAHQTKAG